MAKNVCTSSLAVVCKVETCLSLKVRLEEHQKAMCRGEIQKSCVADHITKEKGNPLPNGDEVKIINREEI